LSKKSFQPTVIAIIGGGRWARVIAKIAHSVTSKTVKIIIFSNLNNADMKKWVRENSFNRISIKRNYKNLKEREIDAAIIANASQDHEIAASIAIKNKIPVLIEKPVALSLAGIMELQELSKKNNSILYASNVFLFSQSINNFAKKIKGRRVDSIDFIWTDPSKETRYGEVKNYDPSIPIFIDWLPHIIPILRFVFKNQPIKLVEFKYNRGGALLVIELQIGKTPCKVRMQRNGFKRVRKISIEGASLLSLDFADEPGVIRDNSKLLSSYLELKTKNSPATRMIQFFLKHLVKKTTDQKLSFNESIQAGIISEEVSKLYKEEQENFFQKFLLNDNLSNIEIQDFEYFFKELFYSHNINDPENIKTIREFIANQIKIKDHQHLSVDEFLKKLKSQRLGDSNLNEP
jgi:hypothetical protein